MSMNLFGKANETGLTGIILEDIIRKAIDIKNDKIEREYGIPAKYVNTLKNSPDFGRDKNGNTKFDNDCIKIISSILLKYYEIEKSNETDVKEKLLDLTYESANNYIDLQPKHLAIIIFDTVKQKKDMAISLPWTYYENSIKEGLELILKSMISDISPELYLVIKQNKLTYELLQKVIYNQETGHNQIVDRLESMRIENSKNQEEREPTPKKMFDVEVFYKKVKNLVERPNVIKTDFLNLCGPDRIVDAYIEPHYKIRGSEERDSLKNWILQSCTDYDALHVHVIKGYPGHGKSMLCLMSVYYFYMHNEGWDFGYAEHILWYSLSAVWYTKILENNLIEIKDDSSEERIIETVIDMIRDCKNRGWDKTIVFLDSYDDMIANLPKEPVDLFGKIVSAIENEIMNNSIDIHVFILVRESTSVEGAFEDVVKEREIITIDHLTRKDREDWFNKRCSLIVDEHERVAFEEYWNKTFTNYENISKDKKTEINKIIGIPFLFRLIVNYRIPDLRTVGKAYRDLSKKLFEQESVYDSKELESKHIELAFLKYKIHSDIRGTNNQKLFKKIEHKRDEEKLIRYFEKNCSVKNFVYANSREKTINFYHESFHDYYLACYIKNILIGIREHAESEMDIKRKLSSIAYRKLGDAFKNCIYIVRDLLDDGAIEWNYIIKYVLERLSVINNPEIIAYYPTENSEENVKMEDLEHTDDGTHNYNIKEYCNLFCNVFSIFSIMDVDDIELDDDNRSRLSYLLKTFDCSEMVLRPCEAFNSIESQRALLSKAFFRKGTFKKWNFDGSDFTEAMFKDIIFTEESQLRKCEYENTVFDTVSFVGRTDLSLNVFEECAFTHVGFNQYTDQHSCQKNDDTDIKFVIESVTFRNCKFTDITFRHCIFTHTKFDKCKFANVKFDYCEGLYSSSFINDCRNELLYVNGIRADDFDFFDNQFTTDKEEEKSCILAISAKNSIINDVNDYFEKDEKHKKLSKQLFDGSFDYKDKIKRINDDIINESDNNEHNCFKLKLIDEDKRRCIHIEGEKDIISNFEDASKNLLRLLELLSDSLKENRITDIHCFYGGPVSLPFFVGRRLGTDFNIHIYQYDQEKKTYKKVRISAGY